MQNFKSHNSNNLKNNSKKYNQYNQVFDNTELDYSDIQRYGIKGVYSAVDYHPQSSKLIHDLICFRSWCRIYHHHLLDVRTYCILIPFLFFFRSLYRIYRLFLQYFHNICMYMCASHCLHITYVYPCLVHWDACDRMNRSIM